MSAVAAERLDSKRPVIMFVDDEPRVLKSMRAMFRRDYEVHLANSGAQALAILDEHSIDVVVSDQRMPAMTGVEVLTEIKERSPHTVRILLTGYADLEAVEASINEAEVFKYLMKPCPADEVRGAVQAGLGVVAGPPVLASVASKAAVPTSKVTDIKPQVAQHKTVPAGKAKPVAIQPVDVLLLSDDRTLYSGLGKACAAHKLHRANTVADALQLAQKHPVGVMIADVVIDEKAIADLSGALRKVTPEMVIILASDRSDANMLIKLINSGQVFRFLLKPLQIGQCKIWLASAVRRFHERGGKSLAGHGHGQSANHGLAMSGAWQRFKNWFLGVGA